LYHMKVRWLQARNEEGKGAQFPGRRVTMGAPNHCEGRRKVPTMSQAGADTGGCRECIPLTRPKEVLTWHLISLKIIARIFLFCTLL